MKRLHQIISNLALIVFSATAFAQTTFDQNFTGTQTERYADGKPKYEVNIVKGKKEGAEIGWNRDDSIKYQSTYIDGNEIK